MFIGVHPWLKKTMKTPQFKFIAVLIAVAAIFTLATPGCQTNQVQTTIKTEAVLIKTVDTGMSIWRDYVIAHQTDGKVTQNQVDTVKQAYEAYYTAQQTAKAVIEKILVNVSTNDADVATANAAVTQAELQLLKLLNQYIK